MISPSDVFDFSTCAYNCLQRPGVRIVPSVASLTDEQGIEELIVQICHRAGDPLYLLEWPGSGCPSTRGSSAQMVEAL